MPTPRPSREEIQKRIYQRILNETTLTAGMESTIIGTIVKICAAEFDGIWEFVEELERQSNLSTATGAGLDAIGVYLGVARSQARQATSKGYARALRFQNLGAGTVSIPQGTRVYKDSDPRIAFFTSESLSLGPGDRGEVHVVAAEIGEIFNVAVGELNRHVLPIPNVSVTNILPIQNGELQESDGRYRERLLQALRQRAGLNRENCDALLRGLPSVRDVFLLDLHRGPGTFDVVVVPHNESLAETAVSEANRSLAENVPIGLDYRVRKPRYRHLDIRIVLRFTPDSGANRETVRESIRAQINSLVDSLPLEDGSGVGTFYVQRIRNIAADADPTVLDAIVTLGLDGSPLAGEGEIRLAIGDRLRIRGLSVV